VRRPARAGGVRGGQGPPWIVTRMGQDTRAGLGGAAIEPGPQRSEGTRPKLLSFQFLTQSVTYYSLLQRTK